LDDYVTAEITEQFDFESIKASTKSIQRLYMRLHEIPKTGVDMDTARICPADIKEMFTAMNYTASINDVKYICSILEWPETKTLDIEYETRIPVANNPNTENR
jgi:hypothetical protein